MFFVIVLCLFCFSGCFLNPDPAAPSAESGSGPETVLSDTEAFTQTEPVTETESAPETETVPEPVTEPAETESAEVSGGASGSSEIQAYTPVKPVPVAPVAPVVPVPADPGETGKQPSSGKTEEPQEIVPIVPVKPTEPVIPTEPAEPETPADPPSAAEPTETEEPQPENPPAQETHGPEPVETEVPVTPVTPPPVTPVQPVKPEPPKEPETEPVQPVKEEQQPVTEPVLPVLEPKPVETETEPLPTGEPDPAEPVVPAEPTEPDELGEPVGEDLTEKRVSFLGTGDAVIHEGIYMEAAKWAKQNGEGREYDFSHLFTDVKYEIAAADISLVNQETLMAGESYGYSGYPYFNTPRELAYDMIASGFDVVNLANNHMLELGTAALKSTYDFWDALYCTTIGCYRGESDFDNIRVVEKNGVRIAFLSYCIMTNGKNVDAGWNLSIPYFDEALVKRQTTLAKECADFIVVSAHWGSDNVETVTYDQRSWAKYLADCGVDVIVGHHPHVVQSVEWIDGKGGNRCLCAYSLGNLCALMAESKNALGGFLKLDFVMKGGEKYVENVRFVPTVFYFKTTFFGQRIYYMKDYTEALAASHGSQTYETELLTAAQLADCIADTIRPEFLPAVWRPQG